MVVQVAFDSVAKDENSLFISKHEENIRIVFSAACTWSTGMYKHWEPVWMRLTIRMEPFGQFGLQYEASYLLGATHGSVVVLLLVPFLWSVNLGRIRPINLNPSLQIEAGNKRNSGDIHCVLKRTNLLRSGLEKQFHASVLTTSLSHPWYHAPMHTRWGFFWGSTWIFCEPAFQCSRSVENTTKMDVEPSGLIELRHSNSEPIRRSRWASYLLCRSCNSLTFEFDSKSPIQTGKTDYELRIAKCSPNVFSPVLRFQRTDQFFGGQWHEIIWSPEHPSALSKATMLSISIHRSLSWGPRLRTNVCACHLAGRNMNRKTCQTPSSMSQDESLPWSPFCLSSCPTRAVHKNTLSFSQKHGTCNRRNGSWP